MRAMKDSGIEWIDKIPSDWSIRRMGTLGVFTSSGIDKKIDPSEPLVRIINYTDVYGNNSHILGHKEYMTVSAPISKIEENMVKKGDLIFTPSSETIEDIGLSALVDANLENTAFSYHVLRFVFNEEFDHQYKKYLCNNHFVLNWFSSHAKGTIRQTLSRDNFKSCSVFVPPLSEQKAIADYLDRECARIDKIVEIQRNLIEKLKEYKKSVITEAVTKGLNPAATMKDSGIEWIGKIPQHWEVRRIKTLGKIYNGSTPKSDIPEYYDGDIVWITPADMEEYGIISTSRKTITKAGLDSCGTTLVPKDSVIISTRAPIGLVNIAGKDLCTNQGCKSIVPTNMVNNKYLYYYLLTQSENLNVLGSGTTFLELSTTNLSNYKLPLPSKTEQQEIADYLDQQCAKIDSIVAKREKMVDLLTEYKKSLIYECVTGKKEVA